MKFAVGDPVVYRKSKQSPNPGPRAADVMASQHGENYSYRIDKYWRVIALPDERTVEVITRRGKVHRLKIDDPNFVKAGWLVRLLRKRSFPPVDAKPAGDAPGGVDSKSSV